MTKPPFSIAISMALLFLGIVAGLLAFRDVPLISFGGYLQICILAASVYALFALFVDRNVGRLLSAAIFALAGSLLTVSSIFAVYAGIQLHLLSVDILIATVHLTLAWHLLFGRAARAYCAVEAFDARA